MKEGEREREGGKKRERGREGTGELTVDSILGFTYNNLSSVMTKT